ncbi:MAG: hypothetical protein ACHQWU_13685 [Gemmatimonadales bacterium]
MAADLPTDDSGFTEAEVREIFERAGQLDASTDQDRLTSLVEVQRIGAEAGLDPLDVARAAASVRSAGLRAPRLGGPARFRGVIESAGLLSEADVAAIVAVLRAETGYHGELSSTPFGTEWQARSGLGAVLASIYSAGNKTKIELLVARDDARALTRLASGATGLLLGFAANSVVVHWFGLPIAVGVATGLGVAAASAWGIAVAVWKPVAQHWTERTAALVNAVRRALPDERR